MSDSPPGPGWADNFEPQRRAKAPAGPTGAGADAAAEPSRPPAAAWPEAAGWRPSPPVPRVGNPKGLLVLGVVVAAAALVLVVMFSGRDGGSSPRAAVEEYLDAVGTTNCERIVDATGLDDDEQRAAMVEECAFYQGGEDLGHLNPRLDVVDVDIHSEDEGSATVEVEYTFTYDGDGGRREERYAGPITLSEENGRWVVVSDRAEQVG